MLEAFFVSNERRIGILGGSFDPIHIGHLILAESAQECFELDTVYFMPCADQPLKPGAACASGAMRKKMILSAIEGNPRLGFLDIELERGGISYTVDSLEAIQVMYPGQVLYFLIGADKVAELPLWKDIERVVALCRFGVFPRPGVEIAADRAPEGAKLVFAPYGRNVEISSSEIRRRVAEGQSIRYLVPDSVGMIIAERHLYGA
jgi:nicotinate-nucleotide adenylyltransferase